MAEPDIYEEYEDFLQHYGMPRRSGRYPYGSGKDPYQHSMDFLARYDELHGQGLSEADIAKQFGISGNKLKEYKSIAKAERRALQRDRALSLKADGKTPTEIARIMNFKNESSVRNLFDEGIAERKKLSKNTADKLKEEFKTKKAIDVTSGSEIILGVSEGTLKKAVTQLENEGYNLTTLQIPQATNPGKYTTNKVLFRPDVDYKYVVNHLDEIQPPGTFHSEDGGKTFNKLKYPSSISSDRIVINYGDQTGKDSDGVMFIRPGVPDLSLGKSSYAQVRILVDDTHYLKGMALYSDKIPDGYDIMFNTNKPSSKSKMDVLKPIDTKDPNNPFGAAIMADGQSEYIGRDGKKHLSAINKLKQEGDWDEQAITISSQFASKQPVKFAKQQLDLSYKDYVSRFDEIDKLTNPIVREKMLLDFSDDCDGAAWSLKAAALPRQRTQVLLPVPTLKDNEIYAPNYRDGEKVALIRYPFAGQFETPILKVNNKNKQGDERIGKNAADAVGINSKVANILSGADFDGDSVTVIPINSKVQIKSKPPLKELENFDPKEQYPERKGMKIMSKDYTQKQMGIVSNLITDMTLQGAGPEEISRAVKHSMVVIDAHKHKLDYRQSEKDNGISQLKKKWQVHVDENGNIIKEGGALTLISKRKTEVEVPERHSYKKIDPDTGEYIYTNTGRTYLNKAGDIVEAKTKVNLILNTPDVRTLSSGTKQENVYADYSNKMKALANKCRKLAMRTPDFEYDKDAHNNLYSEEVAQLDAKVKMAKANSPYERQAQRNTYQQFLKYKRDNPDISRKDKRKYNSVRIEEERKNAGANGKKSRFDITDREWEAIQAHAVTKTKLKQIMQYADQDRLKELAMPKQTNSMSKPQQNLIKAMKASGYTNREIADRIGKSTTTVSKYLNESN